jgi:hypothetical protein
MNFLCHNHCLAYKVFIIETAVQSRVQKVLSPYAVATSTKWADELMQKLMHFGAKFVAWYSLLQSFDGKPSVHLNVQ